MAQSDRVALPERDPSGKLHYLDICGKKWLRTMQAMDDQKDLKTYQELLEASKDRIGSESQASTAAEFCQAHPRQAPASSQATKDQQEFMAKRWLELNQDVHQALQKQSREWAKQVKQRIYAPFHEGACPPFPANVPVGGLSVRNLPQQRTEKIYRWSPAKLSYRHTCVAPKPKRSEGQWIKDRGRVNDFYFGGSLNLIWLDPAKWQRRSKDKPIRQDDQWGGIDYFEKEKNNKIFHVVARNQENVDRFLKAYELVSF